MTLKCSNVVNTVAKSAKQKELYRYLCSTKSYNALKPDLGHTKRRTNVWDNFAFSLYIDNKWRDFYLYLHAIQNL